MNKPFLLLYGSVDCYAGYGARARDIAKVLIKSDKYDIKIISCRWGNTTQGFLQEDNEDHKEILDRILINNVLPKKPDIYIMVSIPSEMQRVGNYNILITAGIETNMCDPSWIEGCNRADLVLTSSEHSKNVFINTKAEKQDKNTKQIIEKIELKSPTDVLFEGYDDSIYDKDLEPLDCELNDKLDQIPEDFIFMFCGHWLAGGLGEDRKNVGLLIKIFLDTFKDRHKQPALILKTNSASTCIIDRNEILEKIAKIKSLVSGKLPNIYLLHGEISDDEMNELYNHPKIKAFVSFTKGEGFGRPLLESSIYQKPIIATNWSGHLDFLKPEFTTLIPGQLTKVSPSAVVPNMLIPESSWFDINITQASNALNNVFVNYKDILGKAKRQSYFSKTNFTIDKMGQKLDEILENKVPRVIPMVLPKLVKLN
jgi:hypothetical protein